MAKRKLLNKCIEAKLIKEDLVKISCSNNAYIAKDGSVYLDYGNGLMYPLKNFINKHNGYLYVGFKGVDGKMIQRRVHILVAQAFILNPNHYPCVCHKDNNKANPHIDNLEWGTVSYNTKKAFDDGLIVNSKGWNDSQSKPVAVYTLDCKLFKKFGSVSEASKMLNITKTAILYQCNHHSKKKPRKGFFFRYLSEFKDEILVL